jgi:hypothetical protein
MTLTLNKDFKSRMVAGAVFSSNFNDPDNTEFKVRMVAGVGFEPTTFRL